MVAPIELFASLLPPYDTTIATFKLAMHWPFPSMFGCLKKIKWFQS